MMMLDFPYTVNDEPSETWTVEQVMHWWLLRAQSEVQANFDSTEDKLRRELEAGKASLWEDHEKVSEQLHNENSNPNEYEHQASPMEISKPVSTQSQQQQQPPPSPSLAVKGQSTGQKPSRRRKEEQEEEQPLASDTIRIDVTQGEYEGMFYLLKPNSRLHAWVGRSQGKKFREKGISLPKDLEVSTTHGKFEYRRGKFVYLDDGSTNGSLVNGERLEPKVAVPLSTGMEILVGQTLMKITLADNN